MTNWKHLHRNPPGENCDICVKNGDCYETYKFRRHTDYSWELAKYPRTFTPDQLPEDTLYINLNEIIS